MPASSTPNLATGFCHFRSRSRRLTATSTGTPTLKPIRPMRGSGSSFSRACGTLHPLYAKHGNASPAKALTARHVGEPDRPLQFTGTKAYQGRARRPGNTQADNGQPASDAPSPGAGALRRCPARPSPSVARADLNCLERHVEREEAVVNCEDGLTPRMTTPSMCSNG